MKIFLLSSPFIAFTLVGATVISHLDYCHNLPNSIGLKECLPGGVLNRYIGFKTSKMKSFSPSDLFFLLYPLLKLEVLKRTQFFKP